MKTGPATHSLVPKVVPHCGPASSRAPGRIVVVADDLTGACDGAVAFLASGRTVRVLLDVATREGAGIDAVDAFSSDVLAIATESRDLAPNEAASRVYASIASQRRTTPDALLFKKIDSAARGPIAAEIDAALEASGALVAVVTPAFPAAGRTVAGGILSISDWTGKTITVDLRVLFRFHREAVVLDAVPEEKFVRTMTLAIQGDARVLVCDAAEQADLDRIAAAALRLPQPVLWAGSAGLARALAAQLPRAARALSGIPRRAGRTILFIGTPHPVTALQVEHLERVSRDQPLHSRALHRIPVSGAKPEAVISALEAANPAALILTGGDTAAFVLRALGATSIRLAGEVAPGIPWGIVEGGLAAGCTVITKSGGFGDRDVLVRAFEFCESDFCEPEICETQ